MCKLVFTIFSFIFFISVLSPLTVNCGEWYEGGNLHRATVEEWNNASYSNKIATSADWVVARPNIK
ncbi:MAG: hypothetical protein SVS15_07515, partial [Thermodesulfobacteriota bacterium]|nr:hypothetical protein [Thermodesulfobacteriota bacterium]